MIWRRRILKQLDEDIREHLERETQDNIDRGMSPEDARYAALRKFGNVSKVKEQTREVWKSAWLEELMQDLRFGARTLRKSPGLTIAAVLAISLCALRCRGCGCLNAGFPALFLPPARAID